MEKVYVTWQAVEEFVEDVFEEYKLCDDMVTGVYGLPRGGLVLAVMISHKLNIPLLMAPAMHCLIVDDICDSGESLVHYVNNTSGVTSNKYHIITMFYKQGNKFGIEPEAYEFIAEKEQWIVFPWEERREG